MPGIRGITRAWQLLPPVDMEAAITPNEVEAASGHTFVITLTVGAGLLLPAGAHITVEVPEMLGLPPGQLLSPGAFTPSATAPKSARATAHTWTSSARTPLCNSPTLPPGAAIWTSWTLRCRPGTLQPGDEVRVIIGPPDGNLLQAQKFAQTAVFSIGVDADGSGEYRQIAAFPTVNVVGAAADRFPRLCSCRGAARARRLNVRVLPVDIYSFNPATNYAGEAQVFASNGLEIAERLRLDGAGEQPAGECLTATAKTSGVHALSVFDPKTGISGKSNPIGVGFLPDRGIYFGEMHSQMWLSMGNGHHGGSSLRGAATRPASTSAHLRIHYNWRFEVTPEIWQELVDDCNRFNAPGSFVTLVQLRMGRHRRQRTQEYLLPRR